jgi:hypothetical protein
MYTILIYLQSGDTGGTCFAGLPENLHITKRCLPGEAIFGHTGVLWHAGESIEDDSEKKIVIFSARRFVLSLSTKQYWLHY